VKIALLHSSNDVYGASRVLASDVALLVGEGHDVSVILPSDGPLGALQDIIGDGYVVDPNMAVIRRVNPRDAARPPRLPAAARLADVVVLWTLPMGLYAPMLQARRRPHIVSVHERDDSMGGLALLTLALGRRTPTQVNSEWVGRWVRRRVATDRIVRSYPSIAWTARPRSVATRVVGRRAGFSANCPMRMLLIGRVSGRKGHVLAVRAAEELTRRNRHVHLTLAGASYPGQEQHLDEIQALVKRHRNFLSFKGEVASMQSVAGDQDLLLMLSTRPESFGLTPLEAWQCGLPVLGIPLGGAAESLALVDGMITRLDIQTIADDLSRLYDDPDGAWRHPPKFVPGLVLCTEQDRVNDWAQLLEMAVGDAR